MRSSELLQVQRVDDVVTATICRPHRKNALLPESILALDHLLTDVTASDARVLVLTGAGGDFCSGADLREIAATGMDSPEWMRSAASLVVRLAELPIPTIAKVRGVAAGAGCNLAIACDFVIGDTTARFSEIFVKRGVAVDFGGSWLLPRVVSVQAARRMLFFGDFVDSTEACQLGLMSVECAPEELDDVVDDWAARLAGLPQAALVHNKRLVLQGLSGSLAEAVDREIDVQSELLNSPEVREQMRQFFSKNASDEPR